MTPSREEALKAIKDILYVIDQCLANFVWIQLVKPNIDKARIHPRTIKLIEDATLESTLLFIRKLNEFFGKRPQNENDDALRAYHFGIFKENGWFLTKEEYDELHIRVGHISVEEVRNGKKNWPVNKYVMRALNKASSFLKFLDQIEEIDENTKTEIREKIKFIETLTI